MLDIIPKVLSAVPNAYFIIAGDGDKFDLLQEFIKIYGFKERVELLGGIIHDNVAGVLNRGHIFLNTSLTETFCLSMLEAASCGLIVVSTNVGGIPEVLP